MNEYKVKIYMNSIWEGRYLDKFGFCKTKRTKFNSKSRGQKVLWRENAKWEKGLKPLWASRKRIRLNVLNWKSSTTISWNLRDKMCRISMWNMRVSLKSTPSFVLSRFWLVKLIRLIQHRLKMKNREDLESREDEISDLKTKRIE